MTPKRQAALRWIKEHQPVTWFLILRNIGPSMGTRLENAGMLGGTFGLKYQLTPAGEKALEETGK